MSESPKKPSMEPNIIPKLSHKIRTQKRDPDQDVPEQTISFTIQHALTFTRALEVLRDDDFNPNGIAELKMWNNAIAFLTFNPQTKTLAGLSSATNPLKSYYIHKPLVSKKFIYLADLGKLLAVESDRHSIEVRHVIGSHKVSFKLIGSPRTILLEFAGISFDFEDFSPSIDGCEVYIPTKRFRNIIQQFGNAERGSTSKNVMFHIEGGSSRIWLKDVQECNGGDNNLEQDYEALGLHSKQTLEAEFDWPHWKSLKKASILEQDVIFIFPTKQPYNMCLRFYIGCHEMWYVMDETRMKKFELSTKK